MAGSSSMSFRTPRGTDPVALMDRVQKAMVPTVGDLLFAGQGQRSRILGRTARGVSVDETAFAAYSSNGPYYYYPGKSSKNRKASRNTFLRKIGGSARVIKAGGRPPKGVTGLTGLWVKYESYGAFKRSLGRTTVDLRGPSAPHMLQAMVVRVGDTTLTQERSGATARGEGSNQPAEEIRIGIYGEEAERARGHQEGTDHLPKRKFMGANDSDKKLMVMDIIFGMMLRVRRIFQGGGR